MVRVVEGAEDSRGGAAAFGKLRRCVWHSCRVVRCRMYRDQPIRQFLYLLQLATLDEGYRDDVHVRNAQVGLGKMERGYTLVSSPAGLIESREGTAYRSRT